MKKTIVPKKKISYILGLQSYASHDSGACILKFDKDGKILDYVAISEERLIRKKYPYTFPIHSIIYCLKHFGLKSLKNVDYIFSDWIKLKRWIRSGPNYNYQKFDYIKEKLKFDKKKIIQIVHHLAHAASTYYPSNFERAAILIADGMGSDVETNSYYIGNKKKISLLEKYKYSGIGAAYGRVTNDILSLGTGGEGKTMGLAPYGRKNNKIKIKYKLNGIETDFSDFMNRMPHSDILNQINDNYRHHPIIINYKKAKKYQQMEKYFADFAFAIQDVAEKTMVHLGKDLYKKTKEKNICLAGGVALNSVANHKLFQKTNFKNIYIFPASSDCGLPFGLTLWAYYNFFKVKHKKIVFNNAYTGTSYSKKEIVNLLNKFNIPYSKTNGGKIASLIKNGKVIGNFHGKSEYGPRALGNRSIIADPRNKKMRDYLNKEVKHREMFRPFAPAILENKSKEYFDIKYSPYMLQVAKAKKFNEIQSVCHVDKTARVQTVNSKQNKNFYNIINEFYKQTGTPCLLNTSFNDAGEPIVETPLDAIICFLNTNIQFLVLENLLIDKKNIIYRKKLCKKLKKYRDNKILGNEKFALKILTKNYSEKEYVNRKKIENLKAVKYTLNRPIVNLNKFINNNISSKKILIIGTNDHTNVLIKLFKIKEKNKIDYFEIEKNDIYKNKKRIKQINYVKKINYNNYDKILISSYQHKHRIIKKISRKEIMYSPYDNSCRSIIDYLFIKKYSNKFPLYSKKIF